MESAINRNEEYKRKLKKFEKYQRNGVDIAYRCNRCVKLVYQSDILYGAMCRKCGSNRVYPITQDLTLFGLHWCRSWNWFWNKYYVKKFGEEIK